VNTNGVATSVTARLYDKDNAIAGTPRTFTMNPYGATTPENVAAVFNTGTADLSNAWLSYESEQPIFAYASVLDNGTQDAITVVSIEDSGVAPPENPQPPNQVTIDVELTDFSITFSPAPSNLKVGDTVTLRIYNDGLHGFQLYSPSGVSLIAILPPTGSTTTRTFAITEPGSFGYTCTNTNCGTGHNSMQGTFSVGSQQPGGPGRDY
jgi:heme/copper-type cytochrome/quinol oxidase subunit 2